MPEGQLRDLLIRADSLLSLLWHRYVPSERKETSLDFDVNQVISDLRNAYERKDGLLALLLAEAHPQEAAIFSDRTVSTAEALGQWPHTPTGTVTYESAIASSEPQQQDVWRIKVFREDDGRFAAEWGTSDGRGCGMGEYSATPIGALAELCATLIKVAEDESIDRNQIPSGLRGDHGAPRTVNGDARDQESSSWAPVTPTEDQT